MAKSNPTRRRTRKGKGKKSANLRYSVPTKDLNGGIFPYSGNMGKHMESVCAMTNPFCPAARGSKIPDDDSSPSIACTMVSTFEVATDASGNAAFSVQPNLASVFKKGTAITGTTVTTWGTSYQTANHAEYAATFNEFRVVSFGVRVYSVLAPTEQSGYVRLVTSPENIPNGTNIDGGLWQAVETYSMSDLDAHVVLRPRGIEWKEYVPVGTDFSYNTVTGIVQGSVASKTALIVEVIINTEGTVNLGSISGSIATPGAPSNPHALQAASRVHAKHNGIHNAPTQSVGSKLWGFAKNALLDVAASAIPYVGGAVKSLFTSQNSYPRIMNVD
jgi:hypothetical protein